MNQAIIRASLSDLEKELEKARGAKDQIEQEARRSSVEGGGYENAEETLAYYINQLCERILIVLEAADLPSTRTRLMEKWSGLAPERTIYHDEYDYAENKAYEYLSLVIDSLRSAASNERSTGHAHELSQLETILRKTPALLRRRNITPTGELDVQREMHDYLSAYFTEYRHPIRITGIIRDFEPDAGIRNLKTAIEFKYAASESELSKALGGVFEDVSGYAGSLDWTTFYTLIYQTEPFESEDRFQSEMTRAGIITWKTILVTGGGSRRKKSKVPAKLTKTPSVQIAGSESA